MIITRKLRSLPTDRCYLLRSEGISVRQEPNAKLLDVTFDETLSWSDQVNRVTKSAYSKLLKRFRRCAPYKVRKSLAETLILSKLNYCNTVYLQIPQYMKKRIQRAQTCAAGYVLRRYCMLRDVTKLVWLLLLNVVKWTSRLQVSRH